MEPDRIYWDSMVFVHRIQKTPEHIEILRSITRRAEMGEILIVTSSFTMCEVACLSAGGHDDDTQEKMIAEFFENPFIRTVQVDRRVARISRDIIRVLPNTPGKDAVHLASAVLTRCSELQTYDKKHLINKSMQYGAPPMPISRPRYPGGQPPLLHVE